MVIAIVISSIVIYIFMAFLVGTLISKLCHFNYGADREIVSVFGAIFWPIATIVIGAMRLGNWISNRVKR